MGIKVLFAFSLFLISFGGLHGQSIDTISTRIDITSYVMTAGKIQYAMLGNGNNEEYDSHIEGDNMLMIKPTKKNAPILNLLIREENGDTHYLVVNYRDDLDIRKAFFDLSKPKETATPTKVLEAPATNEPLDTAKIISPIITKIMDEKVTFRSYADGKGRVTVAITNVESKDGFFFLKFEVKNGSSIPYVPESHSIHYIDRAGRGTDRSSIELNVVQTNLPGEIQANSETAYVLVIEQFGITEAGRFDYYMEEKGGRRDFNLRIPAKLLVK